MLFDMDLTSSHQRTALRNMHNTAKYTFSACFPSKTLLLTTYSFLGKMCDKVCDSIRDAKCVIRFVTASMILVYITNRVATFCTVQINSHNILYCDICTKAFNPASLASHKYVHQNSKFQCADSDQSFLFEGTLKSHCISHRTLASYSCSH